MTSCRTYFPIQVQVRLEEANLSVLHGQVYLSSCSQVRRWL